MFELLACDKKFIFDFFALFVRIKPASLCPPRIKQRPSSHTVLKICKKLNQAFLPGFEKVVRMARFEKVVRMARFEKFFPRGQEHSGTYSVRDKFTAVDI